MEKEQSFFSIGLLTSKAGVIEIIPALLFLKLGFQQSDKLGQGFA